MRTHAKTNVKPSIKSNQRAIDFFSEKLDHEIGPYTLKAMMEGRPDEVVIVDVRDAEHYAEGHIPGARNIPLGGLEAQYPNLPIEKTIVTYCGDITCPLSTQAALEMSKKGAPRVKHLVGGIAEWTKKGYQLEKTPAEGDGAGPME